MLWRDRDSQTQQFIKIYQNLQKQGALDQEKVFETACELFAQEQENQRSKSLASGEEVSFVEAEDQPMESKSHSSAEGEKMFTTWQTTPKKIGGSLRNPTHPTDKSTDSFDVKSLFKE